MSSLFSQTTEYALRAVMLLAQHHPQPLTAPRIAETMQVPSSYLSKVMRSLARAGVVRSQRGMGGGFTLRAHPDELDLLSCVEAVQPLARIERCPLQLDDHRPELCPLHRRLDAAIAEVRGAFARTTLGELLREPAGCSGVNGARGAESYSS